MDITLGGGLMPPPKKRRKTRTKEQRRKQKNEANKRYRAKHLEQIREYALNYSNAHKAQAKEWRQINKGKQRIYQQMHKKQYAEYRLKRIYGMTQEAFNNLWKAQKESCAVCHEPTDRPNVDHCHATKKVRGLLCDRCNRGLGFFKDDPARLRSAIEYLQK